MRATHVFLFAGLASLVSLLYLVGELEFVDRRLSDYHSGLLSRDASRELVLIAIDPDSLRRLRSWPWPRRYHAQVLRNLLDAGAARVALDVDFSSPSNAQDDQLLADALASAGPQRVALPVYRQPQRRGEHVELIDTEPLPLFGRHAQPASVNVWPDSDGLIRWVDAAQHWANGVVPTMSAWLTGTPSLVGGTILVDFSIDPATIPKLSFVDVLEGAFDPTSVAGKNVLIGATAIELGDRVSVPRYQVLPGPVLQALAFETLWQGRTLRHVRGWPLASASAIISLTAGLLFMAMGWRSGLAITMLSAIGSALIAAILQLRYGVMLDVSPLTLGVTLSFAAALLTRVDQHATLLFVQRKALQRKDAIMSRVVDSVFDGIVTFDTAGRISSCNRAAEKIFGCPAQVLLGRSLGTWLFIEHANSKAEALAAVGPQESRAKRSDGSCFPAEIAISASDTDGEWMGVAVVRDISKRKADEELAQRALHDALTGLPNRLLLQDRIEEALRAAERTAASFAVLLLDLDRFKQVNDTLGHHIGDMLLREIGPRLRRPMGQVDTLARLGGDEFAVLLPPPTDLNAARSVAGQIIEALRQPFLIEGLSFDIGVSIGVALYPESGKSTSALLQHADAAMYIAKRSQTGFAVYSTEIDTGGADFLTLQGELCRAIEEDQLVLHYQPKFDARTTKFIGFEALIRWRHPECGFILPGQFIPAAERVGLIVPLTLWVVKAALHQQYLWYQDGFCPTVAVNLSVKSLQDPELPATFRTLCNNWEMDPERLVLEITESALMADPRMATTVLGRLADMGCRISLDDFGTGYSSLAHLQRLPLHELKIDRSFVRAMTHDPSAEIIVRSIVDLAHNLNLSVVAEGVEDHAAFRRLAAMGCDHIQGFLFGPPEPPGQVQRWLRQDRRFMEPAAASMTVQQLGQIALAR